MGLDLVAGWRELGLAEGTAVIVHASLSSLGPVPGGARAVVASLVAAAGQAGTVAAPAFTPRIADPDPDHRGAPDTAIRARRDAVPLFDAGTPSEMGAVAEAVRQWPGAVRSRHPQASVAAIGAHAREVVAAQPLGFALGAGSPFSKLYDLDVSILLIGVGHDRNSFLHHAETLARHRRLKVRRFPRLVDGERIWCETLDVANDNGTLFPVVGREFERVHGVREAEVGRARCRLLAARPLVDFAVRRLDELLGRSH
ncbi:AAC(3) family N-acetyltransferase [Amycolatopsis sp. NPDC006131]|uniref:aminoglycoside N(3)-acetyltransferase n=1 Tax=Amycolatopsis sp. NPDC006131 TaxID=3156731 RepID=UPI0033B497D2